MRLEVAIRGIPRRMGAAWSALSDRQPSDNGANPGPPTLPAPAGWWDLLPFPFHRIRLGTDVYTSETGIDAARDLRTELVVEHVGGSLAGRSIVDLGCLEGAFAIEFARRGAARVVGVEARPVSVDRARLACHLTGLTNVEFRLGDVMSELARCSESFDVVFASGILYHLDDPAEFLRLARQVCTGIALIDTHAADPRTPFKDCSAEIVERDMGGHIYRGRTFFEFEPGATETERSELLLAAWDNPQSFWPLEEDLVRMIHDAGFREAVKIDTTDVDVAQWRVDPRQRVIYVCAV